MKQSHGERLTIDLPEIVWETFLCRSVAKVDGVAIGHIALRGRPDMSNSWEIMLYVTPRPGPGHFDRGWADRQYVGSEATAERLFRKMAANAIEKGTPCALVTAVKGNLPGIVPYVRSPSTINKEAKTGWCQAVSQRVNGWGLVSRERHRVTLIKGNTLVFFAPAGADFNNPSPLTDGQLSAALLTAREWARSNQTLPAQA